MFSLASRPEAVIGCCQDLVVGNCLLFGSPFFWVTDFSVRRPQLSSLIVVTVAGRAVCRPGFRGLASFVARRTKGLVRWSAPSYSLLRRCQSPQAVLCQHVVRRIPATIRENQARPSLLVVLVARLRLITSIPLDTTAFQYRRLLGCFMSFRVAVSGSPNAEETAGGVRREMARDTYAAPSKARPLKQSIKSSNRIPKRVRRACRWPR